MAQTIKLRRSSSSGAVPTTSQLALGEVAINTYDGKVYIKKDVGGTESIVEVGATASPTPGGSDGQIQFNNAGTLSGASFLYADDSNSRLGIGTTSPSTALDVTGTVTADGLTSDGAIVGQSATGYATTTLKADTSNSGSGGTPELRFELGGTQKARLRVDTSDNVEISTGTGSGTTRFGIASNGDISFYEDTGTNAKFFWDASAESLGIGTTSPASPLHIDYDGTAMRIVRGSAIGFLYNTGTAASSNFRIQSNGGGLDFYYGSSGAVTFTDAGSERMRIDSSGNVGIGTDTATSIPGFTGVVKLENATNASYVVSGGANEADFGVSSNGGWIGTSTNIPMRFATNATERMRIDTSGNVGIGTTSPATSAGYTSLTLNNATNSGYVVLQTNGVTTSDWYVSGGTVATLRGYATPLSLQSTGANYISASTNGSERLRITSSGDVGIGTNSPQVKFEVQDNTTWDVVNFSSTYAVGAGFTINAQDTGVEWSLIAQGTTGGANDNNLGFHLSNAGTSGQTTGYKFVMTPSGRFGIGTTSPATALDVNGNIAVTGTVDGRDVAADGTKLDGIESGATADQTAAEILTAIKTVDGSGSGLDADLLDGQHGSYYQTASTALGYVDVATGDYGTIKVDDDRGVTWAGYAIRDDWVFMSNSASSAGIYNDTNNQWAIYITQSASVDLRYNGTIQFQTANGYAYAPNQIRSPIFYDSDNTSYFVNPNNTSNLWNLNAAGDTFFGSATLTADSQNDVVLFSGDGTSAQSGAFHNKLKIFGGSSQTRDLQLYQQDSGYAWLDTSWTGNSLNISSNFTDLNVNTGATITSDSGLTVHSATNGPTNGAVVYFSDHQGGNYTQYGWIKYKHSDGAVSSSPASNDGFIIGGSEASTVVKIDGYLNVTSDARAPIFYDLDNTSYYVNPASTSNISKVTIGGNLLQDSTNRSGLLEVSSSGAWVGYSIAPTGTSHWSIMGDQDDFGFYDDVNNEWIFFYNENGSANLYFNGSAKLATTSTGVDVDGALTATSKSFVIDHPTKPNMKLRYGSLEGPENGVYVRGRLKDGNTIELPDYWIGLVHEDSITVNLTAIGKSQDLWVEDIADNKVIVGGENINCFYTVFAERKDVDKLEVEYEA